jgi:hypothetical protein
LATVAPTARVLDPAQLAETRAALEAVWQGLTPYQRQVMGSWLAGFTHEQTAAHLQRPFGTVGSTIFRAKERARRIRSAWILVVTPAWQRLALRLRRAAQRAGDGAALLTQPVHGLTVALALGVATASLTVPLTSTGGPVELMPAADMTANLVLAATDSTPLAGSRPEHLAGAVTAAAAPATPTPARGGLVRLPSGTATAETPEDTHIVDVAPSPHATTDHTFVALGVGQTCSCPVLLRSTDDGATWLAAASAPLTAQSVVLPPAYPADPRIFVANQANGEVPDFVAASFGQPFVPLPLPPGDLALSAGFDHGDPRIFVAATGGVWSEDTTTHLVAPVLTYPSAYVATLATPPQDAGDAILVVAPSSSATPAAPVPTTAVTLAVCDQASSCTPRATLPELAPGVLTVSPRFAADHTLLVSWHDGSAELSTDGGASFHHLALPAGTGALASATLVPANATGTVTLWLSVQRAGGSAILTSHLGSTVWADATTDPALTHPGLLLPAGDRVLFLADRLGLRCSADSGLSWHPRCPTDASP